MNGLDLAKQLDLQTPEELMDKRYSRYMPDGYEQRSATEATFDPRLAYELALEMEAPLAVFARYGFDVDRAVALLKQAPFAATVKKYKEEISAGGVSFRLKAKIQAEDLLTHSYAMAIDPATPPSVRADLIQWTAKMGDLEPKTAKDSGNVGQGFRLNITFAGQAPVAVTSGTLIEGERSDG